MCVGGVTMHQAVPGVNCSPVVCWWAQVSLDAPLKLRRVLQAESQHVILLFIPGWLEPRVVQGVTLASLEPCVAQGVALAMSAPIWGKGGVLKCCFGAWPICERARACHRVSAAPSILCAGSFCWM